LEFTPSKIQKYCTGLSGGDNIKNILLFFHRQGSDPLAGIDYEGNSSETFDIVNIDYSDMKNNYFNII